MNVMRRRWSINGRFLTQPVSGVQRYAREIVLALDTLVGAGHPLAEALELELLTPPGASDALQLGQIATRAGGTFGGHLWEQFELPRLACNGLLSLCNSGPVASAKHIVCIHDLNTRLCPESYSFQFRALYRGLLPALGRRASALTTVSRFSAEQLHRFAIADPERITIAPDGYEHVFRWQPRHSTKTRAAAGARTIVLIGSLAPHKNIGLVLGLAPQLAAHGLQIAVAGVEGARVFNRLGLENPEAPNVHWLGRISDNELAALLGDSLCLAFPSLTEGFGLPPLEAMALGCPVVASDQGSLPEICSNAALLVSPKSPAAWLDQFLHLAGNARLRSELSEAGRVRARHFSWAKSAEVYLELMAEADGIARQRPTQDRRERHSPHRAGALTHS